MPIKRSEALILHTFNFSEQDKIVTLFTKERGIIKGIAKGARKFGNRFGSSLEPLSHVNAVYYEKEARDLVTISQCDLKESFFEIQSDIKTAFTLSYFSELIQEFSPPNSKEEIIFRLLLSTLKALQKGGDLDLLSAYFEGWILRLNGFTPHLLTCLKCKTKIETNSWLSPQKDGVFCSDCAPQKKESTLHSFHAFLIWIKKNPPPEEEIIEFSKSELNAFRKTLQNLLSFHAERIPKSLRYLKNNKT